MSLRIYLAVTPGELRQASRYGRSFAHMAYRIGPESALLRQSLLLETKGGLLAVSDRDAPCIEDPQALCAAVLRECGRRSYGGVLLDFEERPRQDRREFAARLGQALAKSRRSLYLPPEYAVPGAVTLLCTAMSGGNFAQRLHEAANSRGGAGRLALDVQRLRMDFLLPAPSGEGRPLEAEELQTLMEREQPAVFFSQDLCARYFTYSRAGETHFVLFDDADTLSRKLKLGEKLGFSAAFLLWPEIRDTAERLFSGGG